MQLTTLISNIKSNKSIALLVLFFLVSLSATAQLEKDQNSKNPNGSTKWLSFVEAVQKLPDSPRPIMIDVYTDWCGWCKVMDKKTFSDPEVSNYLNANFHSVKFNAESRDTVFLGDKTFVYKPEYKSNELAISLLGGKMSYPSVVFLDSKLQMLTVVPGFIEAPQMMEILKYFGDGIYLRLKWDEYQQSIRK